MRITHAQPLLPTGRGGQLEPTPLLSPAEAEAEAYALGQVGAVLDLQAIAEAPAEWFSEPVEELLSGEAGELYTHMVHLRGAPEHVCTSYLVRLEG